MNTIESIKAALAIMSVGKIDAGIKELEKLIGFEARMERTAKSSYSELRTLIDQDMTHGECVEWLLRMRQFDDPDFIDELLSLLDYGRSRAASSGMGAGEQELVARFDLMCDRLVPVEDIDEEGAAE